jgi:hypothetical protein
MGRNCSKSRHRQQQGRHCGVFAKRWGAGLRGVRISAPASWYLRFANRHTFDKEVTAFELRGLMSGMNNLRCFSKSVNVIGGQAIEQRAALRIV